MVTDPMTLPRQHPDDHQLNDWPLYGPADPEISHLVDLLARQHGLRLHEIEQIMLRALRERADQKSPNEGPSST